MESGSIQTDPSLYFGRYDQPLRWLSYKTQCDLAVRHGGRNVLEVGVGNKTVSNYLKERGFSVTTVDFDPRLQPDITADVRNLPFEEAQFDTVICFEVLEHLPFEEAEEVLKKFYTVCGSSAIVSVPHFYGFFGEAAVKIPGFARKTLQIKIPIPLRHQMKGQHYWELGKRGYGAKRLRRAMEDAGFSIDGEQILSSESFHRVVIGCSVFLEAHHFFVLKKSM